MERQSIIDKALSYVSNTPYKNPNIFTKWFFKDDLSHAWCGVFVDYIFNSLSCDWLNSCTNFAYVPTIVSWAKKMGYWNADYKKANKGDLVIYNWNLDRKNHYSHVGIIDNVLTNGIRSIEGNTTNSKNQKNCVEIKTRNKKNICGVILLPYKEGQMDFKVGDYVYALNDVKLYTTIEYKESKYTLKKGEKAYIKYTKGNNIALANPITKIYFESAWTNNFNELTKENYKTLYEEEVNKNNELQDKINKALDILRN